MRDSLCATRPDKTFASYIVFATSRLNVEALTKYLKDKFVKSKPLDDHFVTGYRGGYLPSLRRAYIKNVFNLADQHLLVLQITHFTRNSMCHGTLSRWHTNVSQHVISNP